MSYDIVQLREFLERPHPCPAGFAGRGVVISAGGPSLFSAYITVRSLRLHGCRLPIQIWHLGPQELSTKAAAPFLLQQVSFIDSLALLPKHPMRCFGGWQNKIYAITHSPFAEVLLLDADNMALRDPQTLFDDPLYRKHGTIFWPDFPAGTDDFWQIKPEAWRILGLAELKEAELEAGQILINKNTRWKELMVAYHMNANSDFYYTHCTHGDKDTYRLAWLLCRSELNIISKRPLMTDPPIRIQFAPDGSELFQHSRKWGLPWQHNQRLPNYRDEERCLMWLRELQAQLE